VAPLLDETWYLQTDGIIPQELTVYQDDAAGVAQSRTRADLVFTVAPS
jgi:hypothetical protein